MPYFLWIFVLHNTPPQLGYQEMPLFPIDNSRDSNANYWRILVKGNQCRSVKCLIFRLFPFISASVVPLAFLPFQWKVSSSKFVANLKIVRQDDANYHKYQNLRVNHFLHCILSSYKSACECIVLAVGLRLVYQFGNEVA